jgi:Glycine zipper
LKESNVTNRMNRTGRWTKLLGVLVLGGAMTVGGGCDNALQGGAAGAGLGALAGMGIGSLSGDMGKGAAIGAIIGAVGGGILGDQNRRSGD